jgi:5-methylcytosine-specific restriction endonuclease McrA
MPFKEVVKYCENCNKLLKLNNNRDIKRKKFCSLSCRQLGRYKRGEFVWLKEMQRLASMPESNVKKGLKGERHPKYIKDRSKLRCRHRFEGNEWRKRVFERDNYTCQICGKKDRLIEFDLKTTEIHPQLSSNEQCN